MDAITDQATLFAADEIAPIDPNANGSAILARLLATQTAIQPTVAKQENQQDNFWKEAREDGDVVAEWQPLTAVYQNPMGAVVIRQESTDYGEDDNCVYMRPELIRPLINRLCEYSGYYPTKKAR